MRSAFSLPFPRKYLTSARCDLSFANFLISILSLLINQCHCKDHSLTRRYQQSVKKCIFAAMPWSKNILDYHFNLSTDLPLPEGVSWLFPYDNEETRRCMQLFYKKYYHDNKERILILGINPGRFGAGITGVPFTDPIRLHDVCGIENAFQKRQELSSLFIYDLVDALGGPEAFYRQFYISSICPLGFMKDGKNYNYYDSAELTEAVLPLIRDHLLAQVAMGSRTDVVFSLGKGKNFVFLQKLNEKMQLFDKLVPLPHPRWVMQYRLKQKDQLLEQCAGALGGARMPSNP